MNFSNDQLIEFFKSSSTPIINEIKLLKANVESIPQVDKKSIDFKINSAFDKLSALEEFVNKSLRESREILTAEKLNTLEQIKASIDDAIKKQIDQTTTPAELHNKNVVYKSGRLVTHDGGLFQSIKETSSVPGSSGAWLLIADGIKAISLNANALSITKTSGEKITLDNIKGDTGESIVFMGLHNSDYEYKKNHIVTTDGAAWISIADHNKSNPPSEHWKLLVKRGPRGAPGKQGPTPTAKQIYPLITDCFNENYIKLASAAAEKARRAPTMAETLPAAKEAVEQNLPVLKEFIATHTADQVTKAIDDSVVGVVYQGLWNRERNYKKGQIVKNAGALYVALKNNSAQVPSSPAAGETWLYMIKEAKVARNKRVEQQQVINGFDFTNQGPTTTDTGHQITFGPGGTSTNGELTLDPDGRMNINISASYQILISLAVTRTGSNGTSLCFFRLVLNDNVLIGPVAIKLFNGNITIPLEFTINQDLKAGDSFYFEMIRDSAGVNDGELQTLTSSTDWGTSASAIIRASKVVLT